MKARVVQIRHRIVTYKTVTRRVMQCEPCYVRFGEAIRDARHAKLWNQQKLADRAGMSRGSIANIEVGRQRVLLSDVFDFAKILGLDPRKLFAATARK